MLSRRDNTLATFHFEKADYVPSTSDAIRVSGIVANTCVEQPMEPGKQDMFGVPWRITPEGAIPQPGFVMFSDVAEWEKHVRFPDLDAIDFAALAAQEATMAPPDADERVAAIFHSTGLFERLVSLMGFENALCAFMFDPDECVRFFDAMSEFKAAYAKKVIDAYHPDVYIYFDDVATANSLFMSPEVYRTLIKPYERRIVEAVTSRDVIFERHCCGHCDVLLPDWIEMGTTAWHSAQKMNDIAGDLDTYAGKMVIEGGWDSSGPASLLGASEDMLREETRRCLTEYKKPGFIFCPVIMNERGNSLLVGDDRLPAIEEEWRAYRDF